MLAKGLGSFQPRPASINDFTSSHRLTMSSLTVSVVIPTYNRGPLVLEAVESVLAQTVPPLEIIVVDDGSNDDTRDRLRRYMTRIMYCHQTNQGVSVARNQGIRKARGEFIAFLDSDDVWHPRKLELQLQVFEERPDLGLLGAGAMDWPAQSFPEITDDPHGRVSLVSWDQLVVRNRLGTSSVMVRTAVLRAAGEFDPVMQSSEDRDLWLRIAEISSVANLDLPLVGWGTPGGHLSWQAEKSLAGMLRTLRKLDQQSAWKGRRWLRRRSYGYVYNTCAQIYSENNVWALAMFCLLRSFAWYPFPFRRDEVRTRFERPKRLIIAVLHMLRLRAEEPWPPRPVPARTRMLSAAAKK